MKKSSIIKRDKYKSAREGSSRLLNIHCSKCKNLILIYQKDGSKGGLRRLYLDRISSPSELTNLQNLNIKNVPILKCSSCNKLLATPYIYLKEKRSAFLLHEGTIIKKIKKI